MPSVGKLFIDIEANTSGLSRSLSRIGPLLAGLGVGRIAAEMVKLSANTEQVVKSFTVFAGSQQKAIKLFEELEQFSIVTPFTPDEVNKAAQTLLSFGRTSDQVGSDLRRLGELAAAAGKPIQPLAEAFGKANARVRVTNETLELFTNNSVPILEILAEKLNTTSAEIFDLASKGKISFDTLRGAIADVTDEGGRFAGSLLAQSKTMNGLISTIQGQFSQAMRQVGEAILPAAKEAAERLVTALNSLITELKEAAGENGILTKMAAGLLTVIDSFDIWIRNIKAASGPLLFLLNVGETYANLFTGKFKDALESGKDAVRNLAKPFQNLGNIFDDINRVTGTYGTTLEGLNAKIRDAKVSMADYNSAVGETEDGIDGLDRATEGHKKTVSEIQALWLSTSTLLRGPVVQAFEQIALVLTGFRTPLLPDRTVQVIDTLPTRGGVESQSAPEIQGPSDEAIGRFRQLQTFLDNMNQVQGAVFTGIQQGIEDIGFAIVDLITFSSSFEETWQKIGDALKGIFQSILKELTRILARAIALAIVRTIFTGGAGAGVGFFANLGSILRNIESFHSGGVKKGDGLAFLHDGEVITNPRLGQTPPGSAVSVNITSIDRGTDTYWRNSRANALGRLMDGPP